MKKNQYFNGSISILVALLFLSSHTVAIYNNGYGLEAYQFLAYQNAARYALGLPGLKWDQKLTDYAQSYAEQRRSDCQLIHSDGPYGENIFWGSGYGWSPAQAVKAWVDERKWYDHGSNSCTPGQECGHYTQIVWKTTTRVGCAKVTCDSGLGEFMICNYDPAGNYDNEEPY
ncbi:Allergen V5/Tpx-1-related [Macleaya cordata]|uniref:Allergen V5/Tpx-1-related n=1 Tax=Macleaya cordata TaxID=56857 RepID=A0A200QK28_MACCD|nr:Allergen V5/Tpx-1-related [Macleaya cordata]